MQHEATIDGAGGEARVECDGGAGVPHFRIPTVSIGRPDPSGLESRDREQKPVESGWRWSGSDPRVSEYGLTAGGL